MKKLIIIPLITLSITITYSQNLVPNANLEDTVFCPWAESQMPLDWLLFGNSADYLNGCSSALNVPNTPTGYHPAHSGVGMMGVFNYVDSNSTGWPDYREFVGAQLLNPLTIGQKYYMSFYLSYARIYPIGFNGLGSDKLGMKFSTVSYSENNPPTLNNSAHLYTDSIYTDTTLWVKVTGSFIADSAYNYLVLGNFFDESNTDTLYFGGPPYWANRSYYFIDDICVSIDSIYNDTWTGIAETNQFKNTIKVYPNPVVDIINIKTSVNSIDEVYLINSLGQIIYQMKFKDEKTLKIKVSDYSHGIYLLKVKTVNEFHSQLILINH